MKPDTFTLLRALRLPLLRQATTAVLFASLLLQSTAAVAPSPSWWGTQSVIPPNAVADDFAAANVGQLKYFAAKAAAEMNAQLSGGAGADIVALMSAWNTDPAAGMTRDDYAALTAGQLKSVAAMFYDRLAAAGAGTVGVYPWGGSGTVADDYALVNVGQLKALFAFDVPHLGTTKTTGGGTGGAGTTGANGTGGGTLGMNNGGGDGSINADGGNGTTDASGNGTGDGTTTSPAYTDPLLFTEQAAGFQTKCGYPGNANLNPINYYLHAESQGSSTLNFWIWDRLINADWVFYPTTGEYGKTYASGRKKTVLRSITVPAWDYPYSKTWLKSQITGIYSRVDDFNRLTGDLTVNENRPPEYMAYGGPLYGVTMNEVNAVILSDTAAKKTFTNIRNSSETYNTGEYCIIDKDEFGVVVHAPGIYETDRYRTPFDSDLGLTGQLTTTLSNPYTTDQLITDTNNKVPAFQNKWTGPYPNAIASLNVTADEVGCSLTKLHYKWQVDKGDTRTVVWDVTFIPIEKDELKPDKIEHNILSWIPKQGETESSEFTIDPMLPNGGLPVQDGQQPKPAKRNGFYFMNRLQIEISDLRTNQTVIDKAWITVDAEDQYQPPQMPQLQARIVDGPQDLSVAWTLDVKYPRRQNKDNLTITPAADLSGPGYGRYRPADEPWNIYEDQDTVPVSHDPFYGGNCTLKFTIHKGTGGPQVGQGEINFLIRGKNPEDASAHNYINSVAWPLGINYAWGIAKHESHGANPARYNQFAVVDSSWGKEGEPWYNSTEGNGWGMFQCDDTGNGIPVTANQVWSWKANADNAIQERLIEKRKYVDNYFADLLFGNPAKLLEDPIPNNPNYPGFSANDILTMTAYNRGQSRIRSWLVFNASAAKGHRWSWHLPNAVGKDKPYVYFVMKEMETNP